VGTASARWAEELDAWRIPDEILSKAAESPWGFPPTLFDAPAKPPATPSRRRALEALPQGGSVLDVGVGAGGASLGLAPPAARIVGVDESEPMLTQFMAEAARRQVSAHTVLGPWPEVSALAGTADLVVCHHVIYNVRDLVPFVRALSSAASERVVVEITAEHPMIRFNPLWLHFHGLERPSGPTVDDAEAVLREAGIQPVVERFTAPARRAGADRRALVAFARRRLCLPAERDPEVDRLLPSNTGFLVRSMACLWWPA
jgi:SAM-dependent methyltransferase